MSTSDATRNGTPGAYPRRIGCVAYTSPSGVAYRLEHWAILEAIRRWYVLGPGGLYASGGGYVARTIADAAGCGSAELARELAGMLEAAYAARDRPVPVPAHPAATLLFRPYRDAAFAIDERPGRRRPWVVRDLVAGGRALRADEMGLPPGDGGPPEAGPAEFPDPAAAQDAVLAMLAARLRPRLAERLREWAGRVERGELEAAVAAGDDGAWSVQLRPAGGP
jgi:hypothetical protein